MKKVMKDAPRQARRQRALERFHILPSTGTTDPDYIRRKQQEHAALHRNLGLPYTPG